VVDGREIAASIVVQPGKATAQELRARPTATLALLELSSIETIVRYVTRLMCVSARHETT
jgi:hypothetical protein